MTAVVESTHHLLYFTNVAITNGCWFTLSEVSIELDHLPNLIPTRPFDPLEEDSILPICKIIYLIDISGVQPRQSLERQESLSSRQQLLSLWSSLLVEEQPV